MRCTRLLAVALLVLGLSLAAAAQDPIKIGFQGPLTGPWAVEGEWALNSVRVAVDLINEAGGVLGRPLQLVTEDDGGTPAGGALTASKFAAEGIDFVIATYGSGVARPSSDVYEEAGILHIAYGATAVGLSDRGYSYFFRTSGRDDTQAFYFVDEVIPLFDARRIAIMHDNTAYARGVAEDTRKFLQPLIETGEVELVYYDAITPGELDYTASLLALRGARPDIWYYTGYYPEWALLLQQGMELGLDWTVMQAVGSNACPISETLAIADLEAVVGAMITQEPLPAFLDYPRTAEFIDEYVRRHGYIHDSPWATYAAEAVYTFAFAMEATGSTDPAVVADLLRSGEVIGEGITGALQFSPEGDRIGVPYSLLICNEDGETAAFDLELHAHLVGLD